ncbi:MAG: ABC transporter permease [Chloroflexi bacterium]|nr:MAG: ABC transporter permease [Chloroflexota bacterium]
MAAQTDAQVARLESDNRGVGISLTQLAFRRLKRDRLTLVAIGIFMTLALLSLFAPVISNQILHVDYTRTNVPNKFLGIWEREKNESNSGTLNQLHVLGTDDIGRDHLARLLYAGRISLGIGFMGAILSLTIGLAIGIITGYHGGIIDDIFNWVITTLDSIPQLFLLLIIAAVLQPGPTTLVLVFGFLGWTGTTRLIRGETFSLREREYIISARAVGASSWRVMFAHIAPNVISIAVITLAITIGNLILVESALSFLGLGVEPPTPTWGNMLTKAQSFFTSGIHLVIAPGVLITTTVLCLYIIGDGIRDAFDPTLKD